MGNFVSDTKIWLNTGVKPQGVVNTDNDYYWRITDPDPTGVKILGLSGIDVTAAYNQANGNLNHWYHCFTLKNGNSIYIRKEYTSSAGTLGYSLAGESVITEIPGTAGSGFYAEGTADYYYVMFGKSSGNTAVCRFSKNTSGYYYCFESGSAAANTLDLIFNNIPAIPDDPLGTDDDQTPEGGYGSFDYTSEIETPPPLPTLSAAQVGFVSLWNPTQQEMQDLAQYLWTGTFDLTNFKKLFTDPMECVLSVGIIPITPTRKQSGGTDVKEEIVFGGSSHSGVNAYPVTEQFYTVDMGTLHIDGKSKSAMDYSPYAKASIYLPYCGTYALDVDEIMDSDVSLEYHIDIYTGACVAYLTIDGHINSDGHNVNAIMYQFTGNVLASIPITGNDHSQFIQSMLFMGASIAATVASSGAGAPAIEGAAASGDVAGAGMALNAATAGSAINTVMSMKPNVLHSGNLSSTAGLLGAQKPFITMSWSNLCRPEEEYKLAGMPLHRSGTLSDFEGFTIVSACHMHNILCTDAERAMIEQALARGVII